jgi:hypothetical protein
MQDDGWRWEDEIIWEKPNALPNSQTNRFTRSHEAILMFNKSKDAFFDIDAVREPQTGNAHSCGNGATPKGVKAARGLNRANDSWQAATSHYIEVPGGRARRTVWSIPTTPYRGAHFATYPPDLVEIMVKAATSEHGCCTRCGAPWVRVVEKPDFGAQPKRATCKLEGRRLSAGEGFLTSGGQEWQAWRNANSDRLLGWRPTCEHADVGVRPAIVLDPFGGTGTTAIVANALGRRGIAVDISGAYLDQAYERTGLASIDAWEKGIDGGEADFDDLPLFAALDEGE